MTEKLLTGTLSLNTNKSRRSQKYRMTSLSGREQSQDQNQSLGSAHNVFFNLSKQVEGKDKTQGFAKHLINFPQRVL